MAGTWRWSRCGNYSRVSRACERSSGSVPGICRRRLLPGEPEGGIAHVLPGGAKRFRKPAHSVARRFFHERGTAGGRIPVVVGKVMESRLRDRSAAVAGSLERDRDV